MVATAAMAAMATAATAISAAMVISAATSAASSSTTRSLSRHSAARPGRRVAPAAWRARSRDSGERCHVTEAAPGFEPVVTAAEDSSIVGGAGAAGGPGLEVVDLEECGLSAAVALRGDVAALVLIPC